MTLALPKVGLANTAQVGDLYLADISVPASVYTGMGIDPALIPTFEAGPVLKLV